VSETLPQLPEGWAWCALEDVAEVRLGRQRSPKNHAGENMVPYVRAANVTWSGLDLSDVKEMNFTPDEVEAYSLREGDLLLSEASGSASGVGKSALWHGELDVCCFQNTLIRVRSEGPLPEYLLLVLREAVLAGKFAQASLGVGIHHLGASRLSQWPIALPPVDQQARVVEAAETLLAAIQAGIDELHANLSEPSALEASLRFAACETLDGTTPLADLATVQSGVTKGRPKEGAVTELPYIRTANVQAGYLDLTEIKTIAVTDHQIARHSLRSGDVLVLEGGDADKVGRGWIWSAEIDPCLHQNHVFAVRPLREKLSPEFLAHYINAPQARAYFGASAKQTTNLASINKTVLNALPVPQLSLDEQERRVRELDVQLEWCSQLRQDVNAALEESRLLVRAVLQSAVLGQLRATPEDSPEAAATVIAQIAATRAKKGRPKRKKRRDERAGAYS